MKRSRRKQLLAAEDLIRRTRTLSNQELVDTLDIILSNLVRFVPEYRRTGQQELLVEISLYAESLYVLADTLKDRQISLPPSAIEAARQMRSRP